MKGILYLVATPIGNLEDITLRALNVLKEVDLIAAEDTRHTLKLLNHFEITKPLISYYKQNEKVKTEKLIEKLKDGKKIALVSDAGTPVISDPGEEIVKAAIENKIKIVPIPGACAVINALIASGLPAKEFEFIGFLPVQLKEKKEKLEEIKNDTRTLLFYEAPHKLLKTLECMLQILGNRQITLARELTKMHEEFISGSLQELIEKLEDIRGEFVLVVEGNSKNRKEQEKQRLKELSLEEHYQYYQEQKYEKKEIIKQIAKDRDSNKNEIYQYFIDK